MATPVNFVSNATATTEHYTLSLHDALPISRPGNNVIIRNIKFSNASDDSISVTNRAHHVWIDHCEFTNGFDGRSEEHTSELQSQSNLVCRLLLEKKKERAQCGVTRLRLRYE